MAAANRTLMVMAGGTGGHVYPALAVADALRARGWDVFWLGTTNGPRSAGGASRRDRYGVGVDGWRARQGLC